MEKRTLATLAVVLIIVGIAGLVLSSSYSRFVYGGYPTGYSPQGMMGGDGFWSGMTGGGMMGGMQGGMMQMMGGNMLISGGTPYNPNGSLVSLEQAKDIANRYLASQNNPDIELADLEEWEFNFYVEYKEKSTGTKAFQILTDKYTGMMFPEMGPNMMWNTKYLMGLQAGAMYITEGQARVSAQQFLDVNGYSGQVWYHTWHGNFIRDE